MTTNTHIYILSDRIMRASFAPAPLSPQLFTLWQEKKKTAACSRFPNYAASLSIEEQFVEVTPLQ